jgi:hypothetical protein
MAGPFYFAWVDPTETTFGDEHARWDEHVYSFRLNHTEGNFAQLDIQIENPSVGLLAPGRKRWVWFSYDSNGDTATESESEPGVIPLFFGRLVTFPADVQNETITLTFVARPSDYAALQAAVAETKRVRPYWDPIWFDPKDAMQPDKILESRSELWHVDRVTHAVSTSDIIFGEDGTLAFDETNVFKDSLSVQVSQTPVRRVELVAAVAWDQVAKDEGGVDFTSVIGKASRLAGASLGGSGDTLCSYTGPGLAEDWPKAGTSYGGGWFVASGSFGPQCPYNARTYYDNWPTPERMVRRGGFTFKSPDAQEAPQPYAGFDPESALAAFQQSVTALIDSSAGPAVVGYNSPYANWVINIWGGPGKPAVMTGSAPTQGSAAKNLKTKVWVPRWDGIPALRLGYDVSRTMKETVLITLDADMQAILVDPGDEEIVQLSMESGEVVSPIDADGAMPIRDLRSRTYFGSPRGAESIEYLLCVARAQLLARSRAITIGFATDFETGVAAGLSCRKNVFLEDYRLPGGEATGKIIEYTLSGDGDSGVFECQIIMGCAVGKGNTVSADPGAPDYVDEGYVEVSNMSTGEGYQRYSGSQVEPIPGAIYYTSLIGELPNDDGTDFYAMKAKDFVVSCTIENGWREQEALLEIGAGAGDPAGVFTKLNEGPTKVTLEVRPLTGGPFETTWEIETSSLMVPKMIDLEAS